MRGYGPETWGESLAEVYDEWLAATPVETNAAVDLLEQLADRGRVLELAVGTGRIAIPLAERGLEVHGVDASAAMIERLRRRPGGDRVKTTVSDFADVPVDGLFRLVFVVFNTFPALLSQDEQIRCFRNVAEHLTEDGSFVLEIAPKRPADFAREEAVLVWSVDPERVMLSFELHDSANQTTEQVETWITEEEIHMFPSVDRYVWLSELDLIAHLAGLELRDRWGGWRREPFTAESWVSVSVYGRVAAD